MSTKVDRNARLWWRMGKARHTGKRRRYNHGLAGKAMEESQWLGEQSTRRRRGYERRHLGSAAGGKAANLSQLGEAWDGKVDGARRPKRGKWSSFSFVSAHQEARGAYCGLV
jgi:hypothetical protein